MDTIVAIDVVRLAKHQSAVNHSSHCPAHIRPFATLAELCCLVSFRSFGPGDAGTPDSICSSDTF